MLWCKVSTLQHTMNNSSRRYHSQQKHHKSSDTRGSIFSLNSVLSNILGMCPSP